MMRVWRLTYSVCLSRTSGLSREQKPGKTKIGTEVAHVPRHSDITFKVKSSKVNLQATGHIVAASRTACWYDNVTHIRTHAHSFYCQYCKTPEQRLNYLRQRSRIPNFKKTGIQELNYGSRRVQMRTTTSLWTSPLLSITK